jgi:hypothetical protein
MSFRNSVLAAIGRRTDLAALGACRLALAEAPIAQLGISSMIGLMVWAHRPQWALPPRYPKIWLIRGR